MSVLLIFVKIFVNEIRKEHIRKKNHKSVGGEQVVVKMAFLEYSCCTHFNDILIDHAFSAHIMLSIKMGFLEHCTNTNLKRNKHI